MSMEIETRCILCGTPLNIGVYESAAGWYLGFVCPKDGPYSRETEYFTTEAEAREALGG